MAYAMVPIYTQTVGAGGSGGVVFNNIPSIYNDLKVVISIRTSSATTSDNGFVYLNNNSSGSLYSRRRIVGSGSAATSDSGSSENALVLNGLITGNSATTNTFGQLEIYLPNYTSSTFKQMIVDSVTENNATTVSTSLFAGLWRSTEAINSINIASSATWMQYSTFTLYGIKNA